MFGFQSPTLEIDLAKAVRATDIEAAQVYRLRRLVRRARGSAGAKNRGGLASTQRPVRSTAGRVGAPRRSSG